MNIGFLITARLKSRRLPLKIVRLIKGKPILSHMISRVKKAKTISKIIVCTSTYKQDDRIKKIC